MDRNGELYKEKREAFMDEIQSDGSFAFVIHNSFLF